jgi:hypothetical protein
MVNESLDLTISSYAKPVQIVESFQTVNPFLQPQILMQKVKGYIGRAAIVYAPEREQKTIQDLYRMNERR